MLSKKWMPMKILLILVAMSSLSSQHVRANDAPVNSSIERKPNLETKSDETVNKNEKKKTLSFEDELVEGATQKPELFYLFQKKNFNYKRLIKLRENFLPEMRQTSEDLQRARSPN